MNIYKKIIVLLACVSAFATTSAQYIPKLKIIVLDSSFTKNFNVNHYTLNTKELYGIDKTVEIYNVSMHNGMTILLLSVLPVFQGSDNWEKVELESITDKVMTKWQIYDYTENAHRDSFSRGSTANLNFGIVKKVGNDWYMSKVCLAEVFNVCNYPPPLVTSYRTINIKSSMLTANEMVNFYKQLYPKRGISWGPHSPSILFSNMFLRREYLSKIFKINNDTAYKFWTFTDWSVADDWCFERGIDRFIYIPEKGIVGGSYDFWFAWKPNRDEYDTKDIPISKDKIWNNMLEERVMLAEELKAEK